MKNRYPSEAMQVIHEDMKGMHQLGIINDAEMREFDEMCLVQESETTHSAENSSQIEQTAAVSAI
jgi:DNA-binding transcriptional regulator YiaG